MRKVGSMRRKSRDIVRRYMAEFTKDQYGVDVLKVEVPVNMKYVEGASSFKGRRHTPRRKPSTTSRPAANAATSRSFIFRQASATPSSSRRWNCAGESGVKFNGVLCGRATWADGIPVYAKQGAECVPQVAGDRRRKEHRQRQQQAEGGNLVAFDLRGGTGAGARIADGFICNDAGQSTARLSFAW